MRLKSTHFRVLISPLQSWNIHGQQPGQHTLNESKCIEIANAQFAVCPFTLRAWHSAPLEITAFPVIVLQAFSMPCCDSATSLTQVT
jgi:hypothetical protein